jgi:hypothetical protein
MQILVRNFIITSFDAAIGSRSNRLFHRQNDRAVCQGAMQQDTSSSWASHHRQFRMVNEFDGIFQPCVAGRGVPVMQF